MDKDEGDHLKRGKYAIYTAVERVRIWRYAAENGTTRAEEILKHNNDSLLFQNTEKKFAFDLSVNKFMKSELRKCVQLFYGNEVQRQLLNNVPVDQI